jgi:16S rRNA (guanine527-N7)-methyltransferase
MVTDGPSSQDGPARDDPPLTPDVVAEVFGDRSDLATRYVARLADTGISHGLVGPREGPRLWHRHVLNCAVVHPLFGEGAAVADIGSGAGLPGLVLAIVRPDLHLHLIEPLNRRTVWLHRTVDDLGLDNVTIHEVRAESLWGVRRFPYVTARAVARIGELARWSLPLMEAGGRLHALKGAGAQEELDADRALLRTLGGSAAVVESCGRGVVDPETVVLSISVDAAVSGRRTPPGRARNKGRRPGSPRPGRPAG